MDKITKVFNYEVKQIGEEKDRVLRFCGSDETADRDNDIIEVAGWKSDDFMKNPVILWSHNGYSMPPIAKCTKIEKDLISRRLMFDIKFPTIEELSSDVENPSEHAKFCDTIYNMCKNKYLNATSVGFKGIKFKTRDDADVLEKPEWQRGRRYIEQNLLELSICDIPCNPSALQQAKAAGLIDEIQIKSFFMSEMKEVDLLCDSNTQEVFVCENGTKIAKVKIADEYKDMFFDSTKSGARLSTASKTALKEIHDNLTKCQCDYKACADKLKVFVEDTKEDEQEEKPDEPKTLDIEEVIERALSQYHGILEKLIKGLDSKGLTVFGNETNQKDANKDEIDLDAIEIPKAATITVNTELACKPEELKAMMEEIFNNKLNAALGRI